MLIELNKDPLFVVTESPIKAIKQKQLLRKKQMRQRRLNPVSRKRQLEIQVIDPLPLQLKNYRAETSVRQSVQNSKASQSLKKYVIQQERNLRCLRLERIIAPEQQIGSSRLKSMSFHMEQIEDVDKNSKEIHIPRVEDLFKNQAKEIMAYENLTLRNRLGQMMNVLQRGICKFKSMSFAYTKPDEEHYQKHKMTTFNAGQEEYQIDDLIEKRLRMSKNLQDKLYRQKRQMEGKAPGQSSANSEDAVRNLPFFFRDNKKPKKQQRLNGVRTFSYSDGNRKLKLTNASILLFEMNKLNKEKERKQYELTGLLKNSYQNRDSILHQKQVFYQSENTFNDLSPSKQFQLRKVMNKKLDHRLEISKQQVNKFISYLYEVKNYHIVLNDTILDILKEVRLALLKGKVMKISDLEVIIGSKNPQDLRETPNDLIIKTLTEMMI